MQTRMGETRSILRRQSVVGRGKCTDKGKGEPERETAEKKQRKKRRKNGTEARVRAIDRKLVKRGERRRVQWGREGRERWWRGKVR